MHPPLTFLVQQLKSGHVFGDRMRLTNPAVGVVRA